MNNCLVTKLNAVVNDDTLPIIETMQQFTLDAIALSGNENMTEEQKFALNHFFYQVGAITNSSLWQKLDFIFLPLIAGEVSKIAANYKGLTLISGTSIASDVILGNGGVITTNTIERELAIPISYSGYNPNNISAYVSFSDNLSENPGATVGNRLVKINDSGSARLNMYLSSSSSNQRLNFGEADNPIVYGVCSYGGSDYLCSLSGDDEEHTVLVKNKDKSGNSIDITQNYITGRIFDGTTTIDSYTITAHTQTKGYAISASIVGKALTETEANMLMDAVITLKHNFITL